MEHDYMKRGYLLPEGCKDLIDVLKLKAKFAHHYFSKPPTPLAQLPKTYEVIKPVKQPAALPPIKGEIVVPDQATVSQIATLLGQKPFVIIADLMLIGVFAGVAQVLGFEAVSRVARKYGFIARKAA